VDLVRIINHESNTNFADQFDIEYCTDVLSGFWHDGSRRLDRDTKSDNIRHRPHSDMGYPALIVFCVLHTPESGWMEPFN